jgi:hypothetical protein|tara:strand:- start:167 stop:490 length:324 start_codon:yes stop_codon:yes gene_type:complete
VKKSVFFIFILSLLNLSNVIACEVDMSDLVGYQVIYSGTVTGHIDNNGQEKDSFEGCEYGRVLIVDNYKQVVCAGYSYSYAYRPDIVVFANGYERKACVDDEVFDLR